MSKERCQLGKFVRTLLVEDDKTLGLLMQRRLSREAFVVDWVRCLCDAIAVSRDVSYGLVILDRGLPDGDGLSALPQLRATKGRPRILVLTALGETNERIRGLDAGADDYLAKPFDPDELLARCRAMTRRNNSAEDDVIAVGNLSINSITREVVVAGRTLLLPRRELLVLECLTRIRDRVVLRERLFEWLYSLDDEIDSNGLETNISRLRKNLREAGANVKINAVRGIGYYITTLTPAS